MDGMAALGIGILPFALAFPALYAYVGMHVMLLTERLEVEAEQGGRYRLTREVGGVPGEAGKWLGKWQGCGTRQGHCFWSVFSEISTA
jgi:hypothetical protein